MLESIPERVPGRMLIGFRRQASGFQASGSYIQPEACPPLHCRFCLSRASSGVEFADSSITCLITKASQERFSTEMVAQITQAHPRCNPLCRNVPNWQQVLPFLFNYFARHYRYYRHGHSMVSPSWRVCA